MTLDPTADLHPLPQSMQHALRIPRRYKSTLPRILEMKAIRRNQAPPVEVAVVRRNVKR